MSSTVPRALAAPPVSGEDLYLGRAPIEARVRGHEQILPVHATACANCHDAAAREAELQSGAAAPPLNRITLTLHAHRRGGPASRFDEASFCKLLRTGVDPAYVLVRKTMPQFTPRDADCHLLWQFLSQREPRAQAAP